METTGSMVGERLARVDNEHAGRNLPRQSALLALSGSARLCRATIGSGGLSHCHLQLLCKWASKPAKELTAKLSSFLAGHFGLSCFAQMENPGKKNVAVQGLQPPPVSHSNPSPHLYPAGNRGARTRWCKWILRCRQGDPLGWRKDGRTTMAWEAIGEFPATVLRPGFIREFVVDLFRFPRGLISEELAEASGSTEPLPSDVDASTEAGSSARTMERLCPQSSRLMWPDQRHATDSGGHQSVPLSSDPTIQKAESRVPIARRARMTLARARPACANRGYQGGSGLSRD